MAKKAQPSLQASDAFPITPSDAGSILNDVANIQQYTFVYVHCSGNAGTVTVSPVDAPDFTATYDVPIFLAQGQVAPLMVKKIWATGTTATGLIAFVTRGGSF